MILALLAGCSACSPLFSSAGWQFIDACERGDHDEVSKLIGSVDDYLEGLLKACELGHFKVVEQLLWRTKLCCEFHVEPVLVAAANGHVEIVRQLVDYRFAVKEDSSRMITAMAKSEEIFRIVFQEGREISVRDVSRLFQTVLFYALRFESFDVIRLALTWSRLHSILPLEDRLQTIESALSIIIEKKQFKCAGTLICLAINPLYQNAEVPEKLARVRKLQQLHQTYLWMTRLEDEYALPPELIIHSLRVAFGSFLV